MLEPGLEVAVVHPTWHLPLRSTFLPLMAAPQTSAYVFGRVLLPPRPIAVGSEGSYCR